MEIDKHKKQMKKCSGCGKFVCDVSTKCRSCAMKGNIPWNKGKKGQIAWNKGLTKGTDVRVKKYSGTLSKSKKGKLVKHLTKYIFKKGHQTWNEGLHPEYIQGKNHHLYGKHHSEATRKKMSENHADVSGAKNPSFNNWSSREPYGEKWSEELKEQIRSHYHFRCQQCFRHLDELGRKLSVHHIDFNKQNNIFPNLIPLCNVCHSQTNFNRDNWTEYFKNKVSI